MTVQSDKLFCFGFGYVAERLAIRALTDGWTVYGTARAPEKAARIDGLAEHTHGLVFQTDDGELCPDDEAHWLISIPPDDKGCPAFRAARAHTHGAASISYLSTTGVYGDRSGDWVFEDSAPAPQSARAKRRVIAEQQWIGAGANIARLPGIYGPGRSALSRLRAGTARRIVKPGQVFSRIHVDDIVSGLQAIMVKGLRSNVFHFCDDEPAPPQDVISHAADLLGITPPPEIAFESAELSDMARSFYAECKRVSNVATKLKLGWQPHHPTYREGLAAILAAEASG